MFKKFTEGLMFGGGFAISFVAIWYLATYLIYSMSIASRIELEANKHLPDIGANIQRHNRRNIETLSETDIPFHELGLDDQIKNSTVIALARYEPADDGRMKAVIKEFLKKETNVTIHYKVGDEYSSASYYPKDNTSYGDGVIIFFTGDPASMQMSMSYSGDRIRGLGDLPLELLKKKCEKPNE